MSSIRLFALPMIGFMLMAMLQLINGQGFAPSAAPIGQTNDGTKIDQGIAYLLMLVALAITYFIH